MCYVHMYCTLDINVQIGRDLFKKKFQFKNAIIHCTLLLKRRHGTAEQEKIKKSISPQAGEDFIMKIEIQESTCFDVWSILYAFNDKYSQTYAIYKIIFYEL